MTRTLAKTQPVAAPCEGNAEREAVREFRLASVTADPSAGGLQDRFGSRRWIGWGMRPETASSKLPSLDDCPGQSDLR